jgi:cytochrome c oxidase cbb3-type subunit 3
MSDFIHGFWSVYVAAFAIAGIAGCALLLWLTARKKVTARADNTTGHIWDEDLTEMNNPLPLWWVGLFVLTIVFSAGYLVFYPGLGSYEGRLKWSTHSEYQAEVDEATRQLEPLYAQFTQRKVEELAGDGNAMAIGERLFMNNCAQCTARTRAAARASPTWPTATGCMAAAARRSPRRSPRAAPAPCRRWPRPSARPKT